MESPDAWLSAYASSPCTLRIGPRKVCRRIAKWLPVSLLSFCLIILLAHVVRDTHPCGADTAIHWKPWAAAPLFLILALVSMGTSLCVYELCCELLHYKKPKLVLDEAGFTARAHGRKQVRFAWEDVADFIPCGREGAGSEFLREPNPEDWDGDTFYVEDIAGLDAARLAQLLNYWRSRALSHNALL
jgi:hypothetical protein